MGVSICISAGLLYAALRQNLRKEENGWLWALALAATSYSALNNGLTVMEWPLVVLFWALLHRLLIASQPKGEIQPERIRWKALALALALGTAGSLSRSDFGLIPACYVGAALLVGMRYRDWRFVGTAFSALVGSVAGLGLIFWYNNAVTGSWFQQSAAVKHLAASLSDPFNPIPPLWQFLRVLLYLPRLDLEAGQKVAIFRVVLPLLVVAGVLGLIWIVMRRRHPRKEARRWIGSPEEMFVLTSSTLGVLGYLVVYSLNSQATYGWYTGTVTGFILILTAKALSLIDGRVRAAFVISVVILNIAVGTYSGGSAQTQFQENLGGKLLHQDHAGARMGGGDVGKPSFYNDGRMFNLDGLMNNEVIPYLSTGAVPCYLLKRQIAYVNDAGQLTEKITDAVRVKLGKPPVPWAHYFLEIKRQVPSGEMISYYQTDFKAIRDSGECSEEPSLSKFDK